MNKETLKEKYKDEQVLSIKNSFLTILNNENINKVEALMMLIEHNSQFEYRYDAELDFDKKQVIPYVVMQHEDKYFVTKRIKGDERLVGQLSIAVGGHINPCDVWQFNRPKEIVAHCIMREIREETTATLNDIKTPKYITTFIDESTEVSKVHVCLLAKFIMETDQIEIRETDKLEGAWLTFDEIKEQYDKFENWSQLSINILEQYEKN